MSHSSLSRYLSRLSVWTAQYRWESNHGASRIWHELSNGKPSASATIMCQHQVYPYQFYLLNYIRGLINWYWWRCKWRTSPQPRRVIKLIYVSYDFLIKRQLPISFTSRPVENRIIIRLCCQLCFTVFHAHRYITGNCITMACDSTFHVSSSYGW